MNAALLKQNKWVRRGLWTLLILLAVWVIAWLAVPPIVKGQVQKIASDKLGRQVTVGKIEFKPWTQIRRRWFLAWHLLARWIKVVAGR